MILTEDAAKRLICLQAVNGWKYDADDLSGRRCIASACMAWRFLDANDQRDYAVIRRQPDPQAPYGYCGLAGSPR